MSHALAVAIAVLGALGFAGLGCSRDGTRSHAPPTATPPATISTPPRAAGESAHESEEATVEHPRIREITPLPDWDNWEGRREKWLYLDIRMRGAWKASWREARIVLRKVAVSSDLGSAKAEITALWEYDGSHRAWSDPKNDHAVILVDERASPRDVRDATAVLLAPKRERKSASGSEVVPVFEVLVARTDDPALKRPRWAPPAADHYTGPEPSVRFDEPSVSGIPPETVAATIAGNSDRVRRCYRVALERDRTLSGMLAARFAIDAEGNVHTFASDGSDITDATLINCVVRSFGELVFPPPEGGFVTVVSRVRLEPGKKK